MREYLCSAAEVMQAQQVTDKGLTGEQAVRRLGESGYNKLEKQPPKPMLQRIWEQIRDPMVLVLLGAAIVSGAFGEIADLVIILLVVLLNAVLGIVQESKAEKAIEALQMLSAPHSKVKRDGAVVIVRSEEIVPGDIVLLEAGDAVPADMRLISVTSLKVEEAALTGESVPVEKLCERLCADGDEVPLGDRVNIAYMGTTVTYGRGEGVVTATGTNTEMGKIADILSNTSEEKTPLQQKMAGLSKVLSISVLGICAFIFVFSIFRGGEFEGHQILQALLTAVSLAVAAIPEGLVVVVTVLLSIGVTRMSSRNSIIRRLTAVETLGCTQVICSDKTGTLTQNRMTVVECFGDEPLLTTAMRLCNNVQKDAEGKLIGDPTEVALAEYAARVGNVGPQQRMEEVPFDSKRKMMSTIHTLGNGYRQFTKGAPDVVLTHCHHIFTARGKIPLTDKLREEVLRENQQMAGKALRVLGAAYRDHDRLPDAGSPESIECDMVFVGLTGMIDPVRPEVTEAIKECKSAGVKVVMITGDHRDTAVAIAKELGILRDESQTITGTELSKLSDEEFESRVEDLRVYARVQPEHKVRIVKTWKKKGAITAMTGDGVNDAPALKSADIGVGMGITGTDVTKNVADMVLSDDNFASIVHAIEEGRRIYENIRKAVQFLLSSNLAEVVSIFVTTLAGLQLFLPIHILWINLVTDTFPAMALGMERAEANAMMQPPRNPKESIFAGGLGMEVILHGVMIAALTLCSFFIGNAQKHLTGMSMAFLTLSMCEIFHACNMRSRRLSILSLRSRNLYLLGAMILSAALSVAVLYIPGLNAIFGLQALSLANFGVACGLSFLIIPLVECAKLVKRAGAQAGPTKERRPGQTR